ncbi:sulfatase [Coraliomargarita algicola]|uniref:Sulfatase n=1 Tax=Coraliomargarita algicola TaxID=3092156 RepID=A0ABZ0RJN9_9BACT|nr:sulfatase [Coraliomargarita sp. J2-16]WPJ95688.1 sulfatase [Coraliomargarita sp. J2-16]
MKLQQALLVSALSLLAVSGLVAKQRPNIIFLLSDDQSTYSVGCYGNPDVQTPQMDKLGAEGMIFDRHYDTTAICMASRANILTGMYEYKTGTNFFHGDMRPEVWAKSYPVLLREAGYLSAFAGKFGLEVEGKGLCEEDFDVWGGGPQQTSYETSKNKSMAKYAEEFPHSTLSYGAFGRDVIRAAVKQDKPLLLSISFKAPHKPSVADPRFDPIYADKVFTKPGNYGREHAEGRAPQSKQGRQYVYFSDWGYDSNYDEVMRTYHQQVYAIDVAIGMIRDELEAQGIADNTVIIFTSDNGYICGSHGYASKVLPMEEASRVPLMIYDPRVKTAGQGLRTQMLTGNIDFAPTILELAGVPIPENMDGKSLLPILKDPTKGGHEQLTLMNTFGPDATKAMSTVDGRYKYTFWWYGDDDMDPTEELYDLEKDPLELVNLASNPEFAPVMEQMRQKYDQGYEHLEQEAVDYNGYQRYVSLFDRELPIDQKQLEESRPINRKNPQAKKTKKAKKNKKDK